MSFAAYLDLVYALDAVLDGVLDGDDMLGNIVDKVHGGVEGGSFSGACGPGNENDAMWLADELGHNLSAGIAHAEGFESLSGAVQTKESQSDAFAENGGDNSDTDVKGGITDGMSESAVLGGAFFSDVEICHDFDSADQRGC